MIGPYLCVSTDVGRGLPDTLAAVTLRLSLSAIMGKMGAAQLSPIRSNIVFIMADHYGWLYRESTISELVGLVV